MLNGYFERNLICHIIKGFLADHQCGYNKGLANSKILSHFEQGGSHRTDLDHFLIPGYRFGTWYCQKIIPTYSVGSPFQKTLPLHIRGI